MADLIKELLDDQRVPGKLVALDQTEQEILTQPPLAEVLAEEERQGNLLQKLRAKIRKTTVTEWSEESIFMPRIHVTSSRKIVQKGGSKSMHDSALSRT